MAWLAWLSAFHARAAFIEYRRGRRRRGRISASAADAAGEHRITVGDRSNEKHRSLMTVESGEMYRDNQYRAGREIK